MNFFNMLNCYIKQLPYGNGYSVDTSDDKHRIEILTLGDKFTDGILQGPHHPDLVDVFKALNDGFNIRLVPLNHTFEDLCVLNALYGIFLYENRHRVKDHVSEVGQLALFLDKDTYYQRMRYLELLEHTANFVKVHFIPQNIELTNQALIVEETGALFVPFSMLDLFHVAEIEGEISSFELDSLYNYLKYEDLRYFFKFLEKNSKIKFNVSYNSNVVNTNKTFVMSVESFIPSEDRDFLKTYYEKLAI